MSKGAENLFAILKEIASENLLELKKEVTISRKLRVDFLLTDDFLNDYNEKPVDIYFEFDGIQHEKHIEFFHKTELSFKEANQRDRLKEKDIIAKGGKLIRISDPKITKEEVLKKINKYWDL